MDALLVVLAIPLTIFILFVAPVWLWLHHNSRRQQGSRLGQQDTQRLMQPPATPSACRRWKIFLTRNTLTGGRNKITVDLSKKLYRRPDEGMICGVCAGIAHYFDVPTRLVRIIVVLSMIFGLFMLTLLAYGILAFWLEPAPPSAHSKFRQQLVVITTITEV